jgi:alanyl-tRNA synthetase
MTISGREVRKQFIEYFIERGHTLVPSASLVPGGDQTLLFTNAGMVQFKDVFLGLDKRPYKRAVDSQKCMRVAGKHNDLDEVGRDDYHHTFFEMLGNWSFGDYYKAEAIEWAWDLLVNVWKLDSRRLWVTCFKDDEGKIPDDTEAAEQWAKQKSLDPNHILFFGRKDNLWEMAETGPCGPCSEIHYDRGIKFCEKANEKGHVCKVNGDCHRYIEIWNLVFIQYNRTSETVFEHLPARHVDTGMGFERLVSLLQGVKSNYQTDLFLPLIKKTQMLCGKTDAQLEADPTSFRVIADHARAATFLIADGVVPGNIGRNYICRMIIRRAARFGGKLGLTRPFLSQIAEVVVHEFGDTYPEVKQHKKAILDTITREEERFQKTIEIGENKLEELFINKKEQGNDLISGKQAFELYATHGLPFEITRDIAREHGFEVDENGFRTAMEEHKISSGAGKAMGSMGIENAEVYRDILQNLTATGALEKSGVKYDPYQDFLVEGKVLALIQEGIEVKDANPGDPIEVVLPRTCFYMESGGQVADTGKITGSGGLGWEIEISDVFRPVAGLIVHAGKVTRGSPKVGDQATAKVDAARRMDIMRNHTATHLLHAELRKVLGETARQAGSLVAPDRLRFDFNYPSALTDQQIAAIEIGVNQTIYSSLPVLFQEKPLAKAKAEGAMALFGEKYGEMVRTVTVGGERPVSYELCGGTHVDDTAEIGLFIITSEGSAAAGVRRIEAITGLKAYELIRERLAILTDAAKTLATTPGKIVDRINDLSLRTNGLEKEIAKLRIQQTELEFKEKQNQAVNEKGIDILVTTLSNANADLLRKMIDGYKENHASSIVALGSTVNEKPIIIVSVTEDLIDRGINAGEIAREAASRIGGSGGGRPTLAQAGGTDVEGLSSAMETVLPYVRRKLKG